MTSWNFLAAIFAGFLLVTWWGYRMLRTRGDDIPLDAAPIPRERPALLVGTRFLATVWAFMTAAGTVAIIAQTLTAQAVAITIPVQTFWPKTYPWVTVTQGASAEVVSGGFTSAEVFASGLEQNTRVMLAIGQLLQGATTVAIAVAVAVLCHRLLDGRPFLPVLARSFTVAARALIIGGVASQIAVQTAGGHASEQLLRTPAWQSERVTFGELDSGNPPEDESGTQELLRGFELYSTGLPSTDSQLDIDFLPAAVGLGLLVVAVAFRRSERMQRDTEGLV